MNESGNDMINNLLILRSLSKLIHHVSKNNLEFLSMQDLGRINHKSGLALKFLAFSVF